MWYGCYECKSRPRTWLGISWLCTFRMQSCVIHESYIVPFNKTPPPPNCVFFLLKPMCVIILPRLEHNQCSLWAYLSYSLMGSMLLARYSKWSALRLVITQSFRNLPIVLSDTPSSFSHSFMRLLHFVQSLYLYFLFLISDVSDNFSTLTVWCFEEPNLERTCGMLSQQSHKKTVSGLHCATLTQTILTERNEWQT